MTPFDPVALVAMLQAFYPVVSPGAFARARSERPEYFAGGRITGSKGDKLQLPDGRVFDCIFASGGPPSGMRWQALDVTHDPGAPADPFPLEPGPLTPVDEAMPLFPDPTGDFAWVVSAYLEGFGGSEGQLDRAAQDVIEFQGAAALEASSSRSLEPADEAHRAIRGALEADNPADVLDDAESHGGVIDQASGEYDEDPPDDLPEPDPGDPPRDDDGPGDHPPKA